MSYTKTLWKDREVERPLTYTETTNPDGSITLTPAEGQIIDPGTSVSALNMNNIENGIAAAHTDLASHAANTSNPHSVTAAQAGAVAKAGDTMTGALVAQNNTGYTTKQVRNIILWDGTGAQPTTGNGDVIIQYKP